VSIDGMEAIKANISSEFESEKYSNESLDAASSNCTTLARLDLVDVFTKLSIGNEDYWGALNTPWLALYYIHFIIFFTLLLIINCWCGLVLWEKMQSVRKHASFVYLVSTYCVWAFTSAIQYVLITAGINNVVSQWLAVAMEVFEILSVTSLMNGLLVTAVYQYYQLRFHVYQSIKKYVAFTIPSLLTALTIIIVILSGKGLELILLVVLIPMLVIIGLVGTSALVFMYTELWFRTKTSRSLHGNSARKVLMRRLIVRVLSYVYLVMLTCYLINFLIKVVIHKDCVEETKGNRFLWLAEQSILKIFELLLVLQCLIVPQKLQKIVDMFWSSKPVKSSAINKSIINHLSQPEDFTASCVTQSFKLEGNAVIIPDYAPKSLPSLKTSSQLLQTSGQIAQPVRHVKCVSLPSITSNAVEHEHLSTGACDYAYNPEVKLCSEIEEMRSVHDTTHYKPERFSFINSVLIDTFEDSVKDGTPSLYPLHGMP